MRVQGEKRRPRDTFSHDLRRAATGLDVNFSIPIHCIKIYSLLGRLNLTSSKEDNSGVFWSKTQFIGAKDDCVRQRCSKYLSDLEDFLRQRMATSPGMLLPPCPLMDGVKAF